MTSCPRGGLDQVDALGRDPRPALECVPARRPGSARGARRPRTPPAPPGATPRTSRPGSRSAPSRGARSGRSPGASLGAEQAPGKCRRLTAQGPSARAAPRRARGGSRRPRPQGQASCSRSSRPRPDGRLADHELRSARHVHGPDAAASTRSGWRTWNALIHRVLDEEQLSLMTLGAVNRRHFPRGLLRA